MIACDFLQVFIDGRGENIFCKKLNLKNESIVLCFSELYPPDMNISPEGVITDRCSSGIIDDIFNLTSSTIFEDVPNWNKINDLVFGTK